MARRCCCAAAVPTAPIDAPAIATGLPAKELVPHGRLAKSMAFFRAPGMLRLYSGVRIRTASTLSTAALKSRAACGKSASRSWL